MLTFEISNSRLVRGFIRPQAKTGHERRSGLGEGGKVKQPRQRIYDKPFGYFETMLYTRYLFLLENSVPRARPGQ